MRGGERGSDHMTFRAMLLSAVLVVGMAGGVRGEVVRHPIPNSTFPIAQAVEVKGNVTTYYVSGQVPPVADKSADPQTAAAYGDIKTQTVGVLKRIQDILGGFGLGMAEVV